MFIPSPGRDFIISDYAGIELAILAAMSNDQQLIYQILQGDVHSFVANSLAGDNIRAAIGELLTADNRKSNKSAAAIRDLFKPVSYGIIYGSTGYNLYRTLYFDLLGLGIRINKADCEDWVERWKNELFPETGALLQRNSDFAITRYYTESALGRRRHWPKAIRFDKWRILAAMREGSNHPIQATCSDMLKRATIDIDGSLDRRRGRIAASIHDELLLETDHGYTDQAIPLVKSCMEFAARSLFPDVDPGLFVAQPKKSDRYNK